MGDNMKAIKSCDFSIKKEVVDPKYSIKFGDWRALSVKWSGATIQSDGSYITIGGQVSWYNDYGKLHCLDGPAFFKVGGGCEWHIDGAMYTFEDWCAMANISDERKMMLRLQFVE